MEFDAAQARRNITIEFVQKDYSKYAVFPVFASYFLDILHIDTAIKDVLRLKSRNYSFSETEYLLFLFTIIFLGIKHIYKADDLLREEEQLAKILGFRKGVFPSSKSLYRIVSLADYWSVQRLNKVNGLLVKQKKEYLSKKRWLVADVDQTKKLTEGETIEKAKPCYSNTHKGMLGLRLTTISHWHTKKIVTFYKKRQTIEDVFKDFNQSFEADTLPSHTFYRNALYF